MAKPSEKDYEKVAELENGLELWRVNIDSLREQDRNANVMSKKHFDLLMKTIKRDGRLEQLPFCMFNAKKEQLEIISGHHRVRASRMADKTHIFALVETNQLTKAQVVTKQLAHNAIRGEDDKNLLRELFEEIDNLKLQAETGIDPESLGVYTSLESAKLDHINLQYDFKVMQFVFLPANMDKVERTFEFMEAEKNCLASIEAFEPFIKAMRLTSTKGGIRNVNSILLRMCEIVTAHYAAQDAESEAEDASGTD